MGEEVKQMLTLPWASTLILYATHHGVSSSAGNDLLRSISLCILHLAASVSDLLNRLLYIFKGADVIHDQYVRAQGHTFTVSTPGKKHHMIVSPQHIEELNRAPLDVMSLHAVAKDMLQPKDTMHGFEWTNVRGQEGTGFVRALRHILTSKLPELRPAIHDNLSTGIHQYLTANETSPGSGIFEPSVFEMNKVLVANVNCFVFFGPRLTSNPKFFQAAAAFPYEAALAAEIIRFLPCRLTRWIARRLTQDHRASTSLYALLYEEVQQRMQGINETKDPSQAESNGPKFNDGLQWLIDTSARKQNWDVARMVGEVMGIWYGSVHTLAIGASFAIMDLYSPSGVRYIEPLRAELAEHPLHAQSGGPADLPLLDAFLKESARLSAFEGTAVRRQALQPFHFRDGPTIQPGEWVCVPTRSLMRDESRLPNALTFDAWRHLYRTASTGNCSSSSSPTCTKKQSLLTDPYSGDGDGTIIWGLSRITCPGRFYAGLVMKLILGTLLDEYEVMLPDIEGDRSFQWRSSIVPKSSVRIRVRKRQTAYSDAR